VPALIVIDDTAPEIKIAARGRWAPRW